MIEQLTFALAMIGYTGLTATAVIAAFRSFPLALWRPIVVVIVAHVVLVWMFRYDWQFAAATRNGYAGFIVFHGALVLIVASLLVRARAARTLVWLAFVVVSFGAAGAVFRYDAVAVYRIPVLVLAACGTVALLRAYQLARGHARGA